MRGNLLTELLVTFSPEEIKDLLQFTQAGTITGVEYPQNATTVLHKLCAYHPDYENPDLAPEALLKATFPGEGVATSRLDKAMSDAHRISRRLLELQYHLRPENAFQTGLNMAIILRQRGLADRYEAAMEKLEKHLEGLPVWSEEYIGNKYLYEAEVHFYRSYNNRGKDDINILSTLKALNQSYLCSRFKLLNKLANQNLSANCIDLDSLYMLYEQIKTDPADFEENKLLMFLYRLSRLFLNMSQFDLSEAQELTRFLKENENKFGREDLYQNYTFLLNIVTTVANAGSNPMPLFQLKFEIQKHILEKKFNFVNGKIHSTSYMNIARSAMTLGEMEWAGEFIETHKNDIANENEERFFYRTVKAMYFSFARQFEKVIDIVPNSNSPYVVYHLTALRLQLMAYYELKSDLLPFKMDAFKMTISRMGKKTLPKSLQKQNNNFVNTLISLNGVAPGDRQKARHFYKAIAAKDEICERGWLLEKAEELGGKPQ